jgi:hypothetical protein
MSLKWCGILAIRKDMLYDILTQFSTELSYLIYIKMKPTLSLIRYISIDKFNILNNLKKGNDWNIVTFQLDNKISH